MIQPELQNTTESGPFFTIFQHLGQVVSGVFILSLVPKLLTNFVPEWELPPLSVVAAAEFVFDGAALTLW